MMCCFFLFFRDRQANICLQNVQFFCEQHAFTRLLLPEDKLPPRKARQNSALMPVSPYCLLTYNLSTHLRHQIRHRLMSRSPSPERAALGECTRISCALAETEKELRGAEMRLLLAKLIHLHATLGPWQFHNKSRETPIEADGGQRSAVAVPSPVSLDTLNHFRFSGLVSSQMN